MRPVSGGVSAKALPIEPPKDDQRYIAETDKETPKMWKKGDVQTIFLLDVFILGADVANLGGVT